MDAKPAKSAGTPARRRKDGPLTEADWVDAATEILVQENVRGIKVEKLCAKLGVTKGSFYWHFKSRSEILTAMLNDWRRRATLNIIQNIARSGIEGFARLRNLLEIPRASKAAQGAAIEMSIRDWARRVDLPKQAITEVDLIRIRYFEQIFQEAGFDGNETKRRAYLAYCMMMGDSILHPTLSDYIDRVDYIDGAIRILSRPDAASEKP